LCGFDYLKGFGFLLWRARYLKVVASRLSLQVVALLALTQLDPAWSITASVIFVMLVQGLSGLAKDLAKMSSKSAVKILAPTTGWGLFSWVATLIGSKNAVKSSGFLLGAVLLAVFGFVPSGLVKVLFRSLSSNVCYEGDMEWQRDIQMSFGVMRFASRSAAA
jgi:hypothetical protein